ncbi:MAG: hypothetical protein HY557_08940, partial [Euryarchaeota archaeon]|nr:hypothetical protein [Euryarchaeota archaeon]
MQEVDTAADVTTSPGSQSITLGSIVAGIFPADVSAEDGQVLQYREGRPSDTDHYPATQTLTTGSSCGGAFPTDLQTSDNVALCLREATSAGIAFDAASSTSGSQTTFSWTHTTSGSNRLLVVGIALRLNASQTVTSVTYAGTGLTFRRGDELAVSVRSEVWYLVNPALGPNTVDVTFSSSTKASIGAISLTGIDQTTPVDVSNGGTGNSAAPSTTMTTTANGAWAVDVVAFRSSGNGQPTGSPGAGQTERWSQYTEGGGGGSNIRGKGSTEGPVSPAGSITMDWTLAAAVEWSITAVAFRPVPVNNQMSVRHDWSSIPTNGDAYDLCVEAWVTNAGGESMLVQVLTPPATWNTRITVTKTSDDNADQCYTLTSGEFNVGAPSIRWIGGTESGDPTQSDLRIDRERVVRRFIFYTLDVRHDWTGVPSGNAYELVVTGRRGDEDVSVQVLTPPSTWNTRITIASGTSQRYTYALTAQEYNGGNPSVRFS